MKTLPAHLLFGYIVFITPWLGRWKYRQLKEKLAAGVTGAKIEAYRRSVLNQILRVAIVFAIAHIDPAYHGTVTLLRPGYESFAATFLVAFTFTILLSAVWFRYRGNRQFDRLRKAAGAILPSTTPECSWFAAVGIGAGISEEFVFRGFLLCYLSRLVPGLRPEEALALGALIFGMNHLYQGYSGVLGTTIMGALFGMLYYQCGGLLLPMGVHALVDLRIILILTPQRMQALAQDSAPA